MKDPVEAILIFDIGKTNKKYYLFDSRLEILEEEQVCFPELVDDEGDPTEAIEEIEQWISETIEKMLMRQEYELTAINFSTYGASLVHINSEGKRIGPVYNYTKAFPYRLFELFSTTYDRDGSRMLNSGSPGIGMINSGFQLYWLKYHKPEFYGRIRYALHFPQYLSFFLTGIPVSDYTSIGCHTALWNYSEQSYDQWVRTEKIDLKLAFLATSDHSVNLTRNGRTLKIGTGIHDSSAALLPYLSVLSEPFILISTGTWSVSLNPFSQEKLNAQDIVNGCLYYMRTDGKPVIAQKLFLGYEYDRQTEYLAEIFNTSVRKIKKIKYSPKKDKKIARDKSRYFQFEHLGDEHRVMTVKPLECGLKKAYHILMKELVDIQISVLESILKNTRIKQIIIDGGFINNDVFLKMIAARIPGLPVFASKAPAGSALGAAIALMPGSWSKKSLKKIYELKRIYSG